MHHLQHISELGPLVEKLGVRHVLIAPGSRNAPLIQLFTSHPAFICHSIVDERSLAYVALGMARQLGEAVVLLTTSGTAVLNLSPALAEAFHQRIPLLVLTADRPREILSQFNNQVTDQRFPYFNFSKGFLELAAELREQDDLEQGMRSVESLFHEALAFPPGPVHLNLQLTEPLYETLPGTLLSWGESKQNTNSASPGPTLSPDIKLTGKKVMILAGMGSGEARVQQLLELLQAQANIVVVAENISNLSSENFVSTPELVLAGASEKERAALAPELVIAFGQQVVSKRLKLFVQSLEDLPVQEIQDGLALETLLKDLQSPQEPDHSYQELWKELELREYARARDYLRQASFSKLTAVARILEAVPAQTVIHLGNSATIRLSQLFPARFDLSYYSNRGVSGIDGSLSSAVGAAMVSEQQHLLILGDLSFVYDSNALWNKDYPKNLKVIVLNDGGGGIFRLLDGPDRMEFFEEFSVTHHPVSLELLTGAFGRRYSRAANMDELDRNLQALFIPEKGPSVLEVDTGASENSRIFKELFL